MADTNNTFNDPSRSSLLMSAGETALLVVDVQEKLIGLIERGPTIIWNIRRMLDAAKWMEMFSIGTEQYPRGLGGMTEPLAERLNEIPEKLMFSCRGCEGLFDQFQEKQIRNVLVCGIETHVCIQQTVLDLLAAGFNVYVAADAVGSRFAVDYEFALRRMESSGATLTTTEAAIFEWCVVSGTDLFKQLSQLIQEKPPQ